MNGQDRTCSESVALWGGARNRPGRAVTRGRDWAMGYHPGMDRTRSVMDRFPTPPCAKLLGWRMLDHDAERGWVRIAFEAKPEFLNPAGAIQGGLLAAMLDDTMGPAVLIKTDGAFMTVTIDLHVSYLGRAAPGPLVAEANVLQVGKTIAFIEASLTHPDGRPIARATSSARLVPIARAMG